MRRFKRALKWLLIIPAALACTAAFACPNCKNSIPEGGEQLARQMREGYYWSYIFMTSVPFLATGSIATLLYLSHRRALARRAVTPPLNAAASAREMRA